MWNVEEQRHPFCAVVARDRNTLLRPKDDEIFLKQNMCRTFKYLFSYVILITYGCNEENLLK